MINPFAPPPKVGNLSNIFAPQRPPHRYVHLTLHYSSPISQEGFIAIRTALSKIADDWLKYGRDSWILYTTETPDSVYRSLITQVPELKPHSIFTFDFDMSAPKGGQLVKWVWEWLNQKR